MRVVQGNILALDLATALGWAANPAAMEPRFGTYVLPKTGDEVGEFIAAYDDWLQDMLVDEAPGLVIYEAPSLFAKTTPATVIKLNGLATHTELVCFRRSVPCRKVNPSSLKKFFAGNGRAEKADMVAAARRYGWEVRDDNAADACAVRAWAIFCYGTPEQKARFAGGPLCAEERF